jgi:hypothetical protein
MLMSIKFGAKAVGAGTGVSNLLHLVCSDQINKVIIGFTLFCKGNSKEGKIIIRR